MTGTERQGSVFQFGASLMSYSKKTLNQMFHVGNFGSISMGGLNPGLFAPFADTPSIVPKGPRISNPLKNCDLIGIALLENLVACQKIAC